MSPTFDPADPASSSEASDELAAPSSDAAQDATALAVDAYWVSARKRAGLARLGGVVGEDALGSVEPPAWSFGATPEEADELLALVLAGRKTATASAAASFAEPGVVLPKPGDLSIILDGHGRPRALVATTAVQVRAFAEVDADHAAAEGEGDRSLDHWRQVHRKVLAEELAALGQDFTERSEVVLERFRLLDPRPPRTPGGYDADVAGGSEHDGAAVDADPLD